jgi:hypothetical protein
MLDVSLSTPEILAEIRNHAGPHRRHQINTLVAEVSRRQCESLKIFKPLPHVAGFHSCTAPERILRGSNRSGKTLHGCIELARAVTGQDPYEKYPERDGRAFIVGASGQHIAEVLYRKLFRADAFKIIKDLETGMWRTYEPWNPSDVERKKERKMAPPLIPPRMISQFSWENKKEQIPNVVRLRNGWEMRFFSSQGIPPQGSDVDLVVFDEEIVNPLWYSEVAARGTVDRMGKFFWTATAQKGGPQLFEMCQRADDEKDNESPRIREFFAHIRDNCHFTDEQKDLFMAKLSEEERLIRIEGEFAFTSFKVFPEFDRTTHSLEWFQVPNNWTRYMVVDPGRQVCAVLFAAVPPPQDPRAGMVLLYDEIYLRQATAERFAEEVRQKAVGQEFHSFIIDHQGARVREAGRGFSIEEQYSQALKDKGIKSRTTGYGFHWGASDVRAGLEKVRSWLLVGENGHPKMHYFHDKMPHFWQEMTRYHWRRSATLKELQEEPEKRNDHLCDCIRYLAMANPRWSKPTVISKFRSGVHARLQAKRRSHREMYGEPGVSLGAGVGHA